MQSPAWKMGTSNRQTIDMGSTTKTPGPGTQKADNFILTTGKGNRNTYSFSFGHSDRIRIGGPVKKELGPGSYDSPSFLNQGPAFTARIRYKDGEKSKLKVPGPGSYNLGHTHTNISFSFGSRTTMSNKMGMVPGPGNQNSNAAHILANSPGWKIGSGKREDKDNNRDFPGPGKYGEVNLQNINKNKKSPNWVFGKEIRGKEPEPTRGYPGPGAYGAKNSIGELPSQARN